MFHLDFQIPPSTTHLGLKHELLLMGSCFSESIGLKFKESKFKAEINPFGTIYNPISLFEVLNKSIKKAAPLNDEFVEHQDIYHWWHGHSLLSELTLDKAKKKVFEKLADTSERLNHLDWLILTPGTAWVYELNKNGRLVANCHKQPATDFKKRLLSVREIVEAYEDLFQVLKTVNPKLKVLWTISPVRHVKDGLIANNQSKSILHLAIDQIVKAHDDNYYFPSYEILIDQLRDYRFYATDLIHPSQEAIEYIWQAFGKTYFSPDTLRITSEWEKLRKALTHKPFHSTSKAHQNFISATISKLQRLGKEIDVEKEIIALKKQLIT